jgi:hypothetical protein
MTATVAERPPRVRTLAREAFRLDTPDGAAGFRLFSTVMAAGAVAAPLLSGVGPLCPVRRFTGIPCPGCGMRGGVTAVAHGDVVAGLAANPLAVVLVLVVAAAWLSLLVRAVRPGARLSGPWLRRPPGWLLGLTLGASWIYQLVRYGVL